MTNLDDHLKDVAKFSSTNKKESEKIEDKCTKQMELLTEQYEEVIRNKERESAPTIKPHMPPKKTSLTTKIWNGIRWVYSQG